MSYETFADVVECDRHAPYSGSMVCPSCVMELKTAKI